MHIEGGDKEMKVSHNITDTEKSVMDILWDRPDAVATRELLDLMKEKGKSTFRKIEYHRTRNCWMISMGVSPLISSPHLQDAQS